MSQLAKRQKQLLAAVSAIDPGKEVCSALAVAVSEQGHAYLLPADVDAIGRRIAATDLVELLVALTDACLAAFPKDGAQSVIRLRPEESDRRLLDLLPPVRHDQKICIALVMYLYTEGDEDGYTSLRRNCVALVAGPLASGLKLRFFQVLFRGVDWHRRQWAQGKIDPPVVLNGGGRPATEAS
jgi:hypothetical protein